MKALVFCEHHEGALTRGALGLLSKAAQIGAEVSGVVIGSEFREAADLGWFASGDSIGIVGGDHLVELYRRAGEAFGLNPYLGPADAAMCGCLAIAAITDGGAYAAR